MPHTYFPCLSCRREYCKSFWKPWQPSNHLFVCCPTSTSVFVCFSLSLSPSLFLLLVLSFHSGFSVLDHQLSWDLLFLFLPWLTMPNSTSWIFILQEIKPFFLSLYLPCMHVVLVLLSLSVFVSFLLSVRRTRDILPKNMLWKSFIFWSGRVYFKYAPTQTNYLCPSQTLWSQ